MGLIQKMDQRMEKIHTYMNDIKEHNRQTEEKKSQVIACIDSKMIDIRFIRQLHVLKTLKETMDQAKLNS